MSGIAIVTVMDRVMFRSIPKPSTILIIVGPISYVAAQTKRMKLTVIRGKKLPTDLTKLINNP